MAQTFYKICPRCQQIYRSEFNFCVRDREPLVGDERIIAGRYVLRRQLGVGAMSEVHEAEQPQIRRLVAIKLLRHEREILQRFDSEVQAIGRLKHENIVDIYDSGYTEARRAYIAMELLEGEDLSLHLKSQGPLPMERATRLWLQAVRAIAHAHRRGVVHRDIKPSNLFLTRRDGDDGAEEVLKVIDFSVAMILTLDDDQRPTRPGDVVGTWLYMAPEQQSSGVVSPQFDVYALGMVLVEILTGSVPYWPNRRQTGVSSVVRAFLEAALQLHGHLPVSGLSDGFVSLVDDMLNPNPELRPASAQEVLKRARRLREFQEVPVLASETEAPLEQSTVTPIVAPILPGSREQDPLFGIDQSGDSLLPAIPTENPKPSSGVAVAVDDLSEPTIANDSDAQYSRYKKLIELVSPQAAPRSAESIAQRQTWPAAELIISEVPFAAELAAPPAPIPNQEPPVAAPPITEAEKKEPAAVVVAAIPVIQEPPPRKSEPTERSASSGDTTRIRAPSDSHSSDAVRRFFGSRATLATLFTGALLGALFFGFLHQKRPDKTLPRRPPEIAATPVTEALISGARIAPGEAVDASNSLRDQDDHPDLRSADLLAAVYDLAEPTASDLSAPTSASSDGGAAQASAEILSVRFVYYEGDGVDGFECSPGTELTTQEDESSGKTSQLVRISPEQRCTATLGTRKKNYEYAALQKRHPDRNGLRRIHIQAAESSSTTPAPAP